jgi:BMFP domain-containing protein YqiC
MEENRAIAAKIIELAARIAELEAELASHAAPDSDTKDPAEAAA